MSFFFRLSTACFPTTLTAFLNRLRRGKVFCNDHMVCSSRGMRSWMRAVSFIRGNYRIRGWACGKFGKAGPGILSSWSTNDFPPHRRLADEIPFISSYHRQLPTDTRKLYQKWHDNITAQRHVPNVSPLGFMCNHTHTCTIILYFRILGRQAHESLHAPPLSSKLQNWYWCIRTERKVKENHSCRLEKWIINDKNANM